MKKGFTLIELLAVIVILAVISLIAIPQITKIVETSKKNAAMLGAESYAHAVETQSISNELKGLGSIKDGIYEIGSLNVNIKGQSPKSGVFTVKGGKVTDAKLCINGFSIDVVNRKSNLSEKDYCNNADATVTFYTDDKDYTVNKSKNRLFTLNNDKYAVVSCNNGAIPVVSGNTISVMPTNGDTVCYLNQDLYKAVWHAGTSETHMEVFKDNESDQRWSVNDYKNIIINMNGYKYKYTGSGYVATVNGNLTINGDQDSEISSVENVFNITRTGNLTINGGKYISTTTDKLAVLYIMYSTGKVTINDGEFVSTHLYDIGGGENSNIVINGGNFSSEQYGNFTTTSGSTAVINGGKFVSESTSHTAVSASSGASLTINNVDIYSKNQKAITSYGNNTSVVINNAKAKSGNGAAVYVEKGSLVINDIYAYALKGNALLVNGSKDVVVHGGVFISESNHTIMNSAGDKIDFIQDKKPIYITSYSKDSATVGIFNKSNFNIKASKADKCTSNYKDTKSGLCVYLEGNKEYNTDRANKALYNASDNSLLNVDGGTYYGGNRTVHNGKSGIINIKNAELISGYSILYDWGGHTNICSSTFNAGTYELGGGSASVVNYKNIKVLNRDSVKNNSLGTVNSEYTGNCDEVLPSE